MGLKAQITPIPGEEDDFERCWSAEEMGEVMSLMIEDKPIFEKLPEEAQKK